VQRNRRLTGCSHSSISRTPGNEQGLPTTSDNGSGSNKRFRLNSFLLKGASPLNQSLVSKGQCSHPGCLQSYGIIHCQKQQKTSDVTGIQIVSAMGILAISTEILHRQRHFSDTPEVQSPSFASFVIASPEKKTIFVAKWRLLYCVSHPLISYRCRRSRCGKRSAGVDGFKKTTKDILVGLLSITLQVLVKVPAWGSSLSHCVCPSSDFEEI
jgi:hypothetical protein